MHMKRDFFRPAMLALAGIALTVGACTPKFEKGDQVAAKVGLSSGDPCRVIISLETQPTGKWARSFTTRLETPECQGTAK